MPCQWAPRGIRLARVLAAAGAGLASAQAFAAAAQAIAPGSVQYHPGDPSASRLEITIPADSLEVLAPPDTAEIRKVTETLRTQVLHVDQHPEIRFSASVKARTPAGKPFSGGPGGSVKVADRVTFAFDAVGVREPAH
jgi:YceI-like protein